MHCDMQNACKKQSIQVLPTQISVFNLIRRVFTVLRTVRPPVTLLFVSGTIVALLTLFWGTFFFSSYFRIGIFPAQENPLLRFISSSTSPRSLPLSQWYYITAYVTRSTLAEQRKSWWRRRSRTHLPCHTVVPSFLNKSPELPGQSFQWGEGVFYR